jgi:DNA repair protein RadC
VLPEASLELRSKPDLRERALTGGAEHLSDAELLALVIGTGTDRESATVLATRVLEASGDLGGLVRRGGRFLAAHRGLGPAKALRVVAALELGRRAAAQALGPRREVVSSFDAVVDWAHPRLSLLDHEQVWLLCLDGRNGLLSATRIAQGGVHGCALTPRDVLCPAIRDGASGIVLVHNHPSGDPTPSAEDARMTAAVALACEVVGVELLDHVVVARGGAESLRKMDASDTDERRGRRM